MRIILKFRKEIAMRYRTEQRELLQAFFEEHSAEQFTVEELSLALSPSIGKSTVYRLVAELIELIPGRA